MPKSTFKRILVDSKSNARGSFVINPNGYAAAPSEMCQRLILQFTLTCEDSGEAPTALNFETFAQNVIITSRYRDGSPFIEAVNASLLDFRAAAFRSADTRAGGDFAVPGSCTQSGGVITLNLPIEFTDPRRRVPGDVSVPLAEIGQFNIQANLTQGVTNGAITGAVCTLYAHCSDEAEPVLGQRIVYSLQNLQGQSTTFDNGNRILRSIDAYQTAAGSTLYTDIQSGFQLFLDGELAVDGSTIGNLEAFNAQFAEPFYKPFYTILSTYATFANASPLTFGAGYYSELGAPCRHAKVYDFGEGTSATDLQAVSKVRFQASNPGSGINGVQLLISAYEPQTAESLQRRKMSLGLGLATVEPNVSDTQAATSLSPTAKASLPAVIATRG